jgi:4-amino-4-deoxy-L-arabinose transferase-like glycosyltransferase
VPIRFFSVNRRLFAALSSLWLICPVAFAARSAFLWKQQRDIPHNVLAFVPFNQETGNIAAALAGGKGFGNVFRRDTGPTAWLTPVYPLFLAGIFRLFGAFTFSAFIAAALLNCLFSALTCIPVYFIGRKLGGAAMASLAAWLWAAYPHAILIPSEWMWDTSLSALLAACLLWATLEFSEGDHKWRGWIAYGALWGFALLTNPALGAALPFFLLWLAFRLRTCRRIAWKRPALALATAILCCLPWTIRNYAQFHRVIPLRSNFAFELWLGNNDIFDPHAVHGIQRITRYEQIRLYSELGETAFMQEKWRLATRFIRSHPSLELRLTARRFVATWLGTETPLKDFLDSDSLLARFIFFCNALVAAGTLLGILLLYFRRHPFAFPLAVFPVFFPLVYYITHTSLRYRHPTDPILLLLASFALANLLRVAPRSPLAKSAATQRSRLSD